MQSFFRPSRGIALSAAFALALSGAAAGFALDFARAAPPASGNATATAAKRNLVALISIS